MNKDYLELYLELELLMASLYQRFEKRYAAYKDLWLSLIADEREHAGYLEHFRALTAEQKMTFAEGKARAAALSSIIAYIKSLIEEFDRQPFLLQKALGVCMDLEKSVLERDVFRAFDSDSTEIKQVLGILREAQEEHLKKIQDLCARRTASMV